VRSRKQAIAIALSEANRVKKWTTIGQ
jgi:hypothetical protein